MPEEVDAVVIGAGFAGPIAGAYLAKGGFKTIVFEGTKMIGGPKMGSYSRSGFHSGVCCHVPVWYTGNDGRGWWPVAAAETGADITWECLPNTGIYMGGRIVIMPCCTTGRAFVEFLKGLAPIQIPAASQEALIKCWDAAMALPEEKLWSAEMDTMPCGVWLDKITDDEIAKLLLATVGSLSLVLPAEMVFENLSVSMLAGAIFRALAGRLWLTTTIGGTEDSIPKAFCEVVMRNGGQVLTNHRVSRVIVEGGNAKGIVVNDANEKEEIYRANHVIVATDYRSLKPLLGEELPVEIEEILEAFETWLTTSLDVHFGLKRQVVKPWWSQVVVLSDAGEYRGCVLVPSHFEPSHAPPGKQLLQAEVFMPTNKYKEHSRKQWVQELTDMVEDVFPGVKTEIEMTHTYAMEGPMHYAYRPIRKVPLQCPGISNLYFIGDYTQAPCTNVERAAASAMIVAKSIISGSW